MFPIVRMRTLAPAIREMEIKAPRIARKQQAGQFVLVRVHPRGERIPLTIKDADPKKGTITLVIQGVGKTTNLMNMLEEGDALLDVAGPLGSPSEIRYFGTAVVIGGGVGTAIAYPVARALKKAGNTVISIVGARSKDLVILEDEVRAVSDVTYVVTDDGSYGEKGLVIDPLKKLVASNGRGIDFVLAIGPIPMMRAVAEVTRPDGIHTVVSLNSIMVDGTGMCGGCRVLVGDHSKFACVDGPEFDAHQVDFTVLAQRNAMYRENERIANERFAESAAAEIAEIRRLAKAAEETVNA
ncbi:MAG TPA: sulfide/dihydroorotate dehydrogenase-like FAD/NAD-binding protein [Thermoanaerobaculia bacterium]